MRPDWFDRLVEKSKGRDLDEFRLLDTLFNQSQAVAHDRFDTRKYDDIRDQAEELQNISNERFEEDPSWPNLIKDAYLALWKAHPELVDESSMLKSHMLNRAVMEKLFGTRQYEELRTWTMLDDWAAAMGTLSLVLKLGEFFDEQKDLKERQEQLQQQEMDMLEQMQQMETLGESATEQDIEEFLDQMEQDLQDYEEAAEEFEDSIQAQQVRIREAAQEGMEAAEDEAEQTAGLVQGFGTDPGQWTKLDAKVRMKLAARLRHNRTLHEIAKLIGRMKRLAVGQWSQRVIHGVDEVYDVTLGNDLSRIVPSELIYLADEDLEDIFWYRYATKGLLERKLRGAEKTAQGAIIAMMDNSGSMMGEREIWGKAVCLSLLEIAKREHRDFYGIHFSGPYDELKEWYFPKGDVELIDALDYAEWFSGGGTDIEKPLSRGVDVLEAMFNSDGSQKGDLIMITDGEGVVHEEWLSRYRNAKEELAFRTYGVLINGKNAMQYWPALDAVSDQVWLINDIATGGDVKDMFGMF